MGGFLDILTLRLGAACSKGSFMGQAHVSKGTEVAKSGQGRPAWSGHHGGSTSADPRSEHESFVGHTLRVLVVFN